MLSFYMIRRQSEFKKNLAKLIVIFQKIEKKCENIQSKSTNIRTILTSLFNQRTTKNRKVSFTCETKLHKNRPNNFADPLRLAAHNIHKP